MTQVEDGGQGVRRGVSVGWQLDSINRQGFSVQLLREYASGQHPYTITFQATESAQEQGF